jgi:hypothetical protein
VARKDKRIGRSGPGRRQIVERERHLLAVEIHLEHPVDRLANGRELIECRPKQFLLQHAVDSRDENDEAGVQRLRSVETPEVARL